MKKRKKKKATDENATDETAGELQEVVYIIKADKTVEKRVVTTGIQDFNYFEITAGLKEGEQVVTGPNTAVGTNLRTGKKVLIVKKEQLFENK